MGLAAPAVVLVVEMPCFHQRQTRCGLRSGRRSGPRQQTSPERGKLSQL